VKPHGLRGEVVVELFGGRPERAEPGTEFSTVSGPLRIEQASRFEGRWTDRFIMTFAGVRGRDGAERLRDLVLLAPPLDDPDILWVHELVGAEVVEAGGGSLGTVRAVLPNPASDLLELDGGGLVPLRFVVDRRPGQLVVEVPDGLFDLD
jgi:16S rRNA processing protein RimM